MITLPANDPTIGPINDHVLGGRRSLADSTQVANQFVPGSQTLLFTPLIRAFIRPIRPIRPIAPSPCLRIIRPNAPKLALWDGWDGEVVRVDI